MTETTDDWVCACRMQPETLGRYVEHTPTHCGIFTTETINAMCADIYGMDQLPIPERRRLTPIEDDD